MFPIGVYKLILYYMCNNLFNEKRGNENMNRTDKINPDYYSNHPSGIECIQITEHMDFLTGNAIKYLWRAAMKGDKINDLEKAKWYIQRIIDKEDMCEDNTTELEDENISNCCKHVNTSFNEI